MFISKKVSSAITCPIALLAMVGCSDGMSDKSANAGSVNQSENQVQTPAAANSQNAKSFMGTTRGRVSEINADGSVVVLGQTIAISDATMFFGTSSGDITVGDYVSIEGSVNGSGRVVAGAITLDTSSDPMVTLMGVISNLDFENGYFQVGDITVGFDAIKVANFDSTKLSNGMVVEIAADEQNFDTGITGISVDSIAVLENGSTVSIGTDGVFVSDDEGTVVVNENGVVINDSEGTTSVTTDGIIVDDVNLQEMIDDTVDETIKEILDLGDLSSYNYTDIELSASSNCLSIGAPTQFQVTGNTTNDLNELVTHNLSGQVALQSGSPSNLSVVANDGTGIYLNMSEQDIVQMQIVAGDTTLTHFVGALPDTVVRPVVLAKQTADWCSFIVFEQDNCTSITNTSSAIDVDNGQASINSSLGGTCITAGQTVIDASAAGTGITIDGELLVDTASNQWVSQGGMVDFVSDAGGLSVSGCTLSNPENIPVIRVI